MAFTSVWRKWFTSYRGTVNRRTGAARRPLRSWGGLRLERLEDRTVPSFFPAPGSPFPAGGNRPFIPATGHFTSSGHTDLVVPNANSGTVSVLLGAGDGTFAQAPGSPITVEAAGTNFGPFQAVVGNFTASGNQDIALTDPQHGAVIVLLGLGNGVFAPPITYSFTGRPVPTGITTGDFDNDGNTDLAVANTAAGTISILENNGLGVFTIQPPIPVGTTPQGIAAGHFTGGGNTDLAVVNAGSSNVSILLGNGNNTFTPAPGSPISVGASPHQVVVSDFNGDSFQDLAIANTAAGTVTVLLGNGDGTFTQATGSPFAVGTQPEGIAAADFSGDGKNDIVTANMGSNDISFLRGKGDGTFQAAVSTPTGSGTVPAGVTVGDFNGDTVPDVAVTDSGNNLVSVFLTNNNTDVGVVKTGPTTVTAGTNATYTLSVTNNGPSDAYDVSLTDAVPNFTLFVSQSQSTGPAFTLNSPPVNSQGTATDTIATLPAGASATFQFVVMVSPAVGAGSSYTNTANISSSNPDTNAANNSSSVHSTVTAVADLGVAKSGPATVTAGTNITYTISITNNGPSDSQGAMLTDVLPNFATFVSESQLSGPTFTFNNPPPGNGGTVSGGIATFQSGASATFQLVLQVLPAIGAGTPVDNTATVSSPNTPDNNPGNNSSTVETHVVASADLGVNKAGPGFAPAGSNITYSVSVTNIGPSDSQGTTLTDAVPANTTFVSESQTSGPTFAFTNPSPGGTGTITGSISTLSASASATFVFVVNITSGTTNGTTITNVANISSPNTPDPNSANNNSTVNTIVGTPNADLGVTKTAPATVTAGSALTYSVSVTNNGPSDSQTVTLDDTVPTGTTFVSESQTTGPTFTFSNPSPGGTGNIHGSIATFGNGQSATFVFVVQTSSSATSGTITNVATIGSATTDNVPGNNSSTATSSVVTAADLGVTKTGPATVTAGSNVTYTVSVTNSGPSDAQNVTLSDTVPGFTSFVSESQLTGPTFNFTNPSVGGGGTSSGTIATLAVGQSATFQFVMLVSSHIGNGTPITDTATIGSDTTDPNPANNRSSSQAHAVASADLGVNKTGPAGVTAGNNLTYTITFSNAGPSDSQGATLSDAVPTNTTFVSVTQLSGPTFTPSAPAPGGTGTITEAIGTFSASATATFQVVVNVNSSTTSGTTITNTATVSSPNTPDPNSANDTSSTTASVSVAADLQTTKTGPASVVAGGNITYTVTLTNAGPSDAHTITLTDMTPANTTFVSESQLTGPSFLFTNPGSGSTGTISGTTPTMTAGTSATFQIVLKVNNGTPISTIITNQATASESTFDPDHSNDTGTWMTTVVPPS